MAKHLRGSNFNAHWRMHARAKAALARKRGHKPLALLKLYHSKMERNLGKLESVINRREAMGE
jgi:hypothetical protein